MKPELQDTPPQLVEQNRIHCGFFKTPFRRVNLLDASNLGGRLGKPLRWLRLKEWVGFGLSHPRLYGGMLVQSAKYAASGTIYLYDRKSGYLFEWLVIPLPSQVQLPETLWSGETRCGRGSRLIQFKHDLFDHRHLVHAEIKGERFAPPLVVDLVLHQDWRATDPLVVSLPIPPDHHTYTHKSPLHLEGIIRIGDTTHTFDPTRDLGNLDEQKTFYPYRSSWKWGCFAAHSAEGREIMLNFVDQMTPKGEPGEDALWIDGKLTFLDQPDIVPLQDPGEYRIQDKNGGLNLHFSPDGCKREKRNYGLIAVDYAQNFGRYNGEVVDAEGNRHRLHDAFGVLERMSARF